MTGDQQDIMWEPPPAPGLDMAGSLSLDTARRYVHANREKGVACPCCGQHTKLYKRKLNSGMAATLIWIVRTMTRVTEYWIDVPKLAPRQVLQSARDFTVLQHWGLIERPAPDPDGKKKHPGLWRATSKGRMFAYGHGSVPAHVFLFNGVCEGISPENITIREALGERFDYDELMSA